MSNIEEARRVLKIEAQALLDMAEKLDDSFNKAVDMVMSCRGKLIISGIGKSGQIARKISSTFSSTGTPSLFLHPAESFCITQSVHSSKTGSIFLHRSLSPIGSSLCNPKYLLSLFIAFL